MPILSEFSLAMLVVSAPAFAKANQAEINALKDITTSQRNRRNSYGAKLNATASAPTASGMST